MAHHDPLSPDTHDPLREHSRFPLVLLVLTLVLCAVTGWAPAAGHLNWSLTMVPGLILMAVLTASFRWVPMSRFVYGCLFVWMLLLLYAAYYSDVQAPLGEWFRERFAMERNHADRVGHVALGTFSAVLVREIMLRRMTIKPGFGALFMVVSVVCTIGAAWEGLEWAFVLLAEPETGQAFLGVQGDVWDAHWDMLLAIVGAVVMLALTRGVHTRSMAQVPRASGFVNPHFEVWRDAGRATQKLPAQGVRAPAAAKARVRRRGRPLTPHGEAV